MQEFNFKKHAPAAQATARYVFDAISDQADRPIALIVRHAGESNPAFVSAAFKAANAARGRSRGSLTPAVVRLDREEDAALFAKTVVVSWENVPFVDGKPAPCEPEVVERFLMAVIDARPDVFDAFRAFCRSAENFRDAAVASAEELGKG